MDDRIAEMKKASDVENTLKSLGLGKELARVKEKRSRAGRGKTRGRRTIQRKGPLIIVSEDKGIVKAARNVAGVEATTLANLDVEMLAPGTHPGRLTVWTRSAAEQLAKTAE